jgi:hypothetical protein
MKGKGVTSPKKLMNNQVKESYRVIKRLTKYSAFTKLSHERGKPRVLSMEQHHLESKLRKYKSSILLVDKQKDT